MAEPLIRAATAGDVASLSAIANDAGYRWGTLRMPYHSLDQTSRYLAGLGEDDRLLVAELDGQLVGNAGLHRQRGRRAHVGILGMGVRDSARRQGVGTALLRAVLDLADNWLDLRRLELTVYVDNAPAIGLYERHGFVREGVMAAYAFRDGRYVDSLMMARLRAPQ